MDPTTLTIGGLAALAAFNGMQWYFARRDACDERASHAQTAAAFDQITDNRMDQIMTLSNLRSNAFITNERGHRVRYVNASQEARAKAEGGDHA